MLFLGKFDRDNVSGVNPERTRVLGAVILHRLYPHGILQQVRITFGG